MENIFIEAVSLLKQGHCFVMASIVDAVGSMPRTNGSNMLVRQDGSIFATIGGGRIEADAIEIAKQILTSKEPMLYHFNLANNDAAVSDMICGGQGDIMLYPAKIEDLPVYEAAREAIENQQKGCLVTVFDKNRLHPCFQCFVNYNNHIICPMNLSTEITSLILDASSGANMHTEETSGLHIYCQSINPCGLVYIFGAGHVAREVAKAAGFVEFPTVVIDDRAEFANKFRFPSSRIMVLESFDKLPDLQISSEDYILILTRGHIFDRECLEWALKTDAGYVGMIGSKRKRDMIYNKLLESGVTQENINRVHSPIGISISAQTPAEIAISIVAELIQHRASRAIK